jgi:hypothetical protein
MVGRKDIEEAHTAFVKLMDAIGPDGVRIKDIDGEPTTRFETARWLWQHVPAMGTPLEDDPARSVGRGWPDPRRPGVPPKTDHGFHWVMWPETGVLMMAQWSGVGVLSDDQGKRPWDDSLEMWVISYLGCFVEPKDMAHLDYIGPATPPVIDGYLRMGPRRGSQDLRGKRWLGATRKP